MTDGSSSFLFRQVWVRIRAVAHVEGLRLLRDRTSFSLIVAVPVLQIILFGAAVNLDPRQVSLAVVGGSPSTQKTVTQVAKNTGYFNEAQLGLEPDRATDLIARRLASVVIELPDDSALFEEDTPDDFDETTRVFIDGSDAGAVAPALSALEREMWRHVARGLAEDADLESLIKSREKIETVWLYNPGRDTTWTLLPGLLGVIVMISMLMLGALSLAREREQGTWEALLMMPTTAAEVLAGKVLPYIAIAFVQVILVTMCATIGFGLPFVGSVLLLFTGTLLFAFAHLVLGFLLSAVVENQIQALQGAVAFYLPSMLLSGFMFPFSGMPGWAQIVGNVLPLTHYVRFARDIMLKGSPGAEAAGFLAPIALFALVASLMALILFRRRLD